MSQNRDMGHPLSLLGAPHLAFEMWVSTQKKSSTSCANDRRATWNPCLKIETCGTPFPRRVPGAGALHLVFEMWVSAQKKSPISRADDHGVNLEPMSQNRDMGHPLSLPGAPHLAFEMWVSAQKKSSTSRANDRRATWNPCLKIETWGTRFLYRVPHISRLRCGSRRRRKARHPARTIAAPPGTHVSKSRHGAPAFLADSHPAGSKEDLVWQVAPVTVVRLLSWPPVWPAACVL